MRNEADHALYHRGIKNLKKYGLSIIAGVGAVEIGGGWFIALGKGTGF